MKALVDGLRALGPARLAAMGAVALGMLGLLALMVLRGGTEQMALLYGDLDLRDSGQVVDQLDPPAHPVSASPPAAARSWCRPIRCRRPGCCWPRTACRPAARSATRSSIAATASPPPSSSRRSTRPARWRASWRAPSAPCSGVRAARVHLVLPQREPFARERQDAQASVMLTMAGAGAAGPRGRAGHPQSGRRRGAGAAAAEHRHRRCARRSVGARRRTGRRRPAQALTTEEVRRATELRLSRAVEEMLERSLGAGHVRAEAAVRMNFDKVNETEERYDPDGQVTRSTQTVDQQHQDHRAERHGHGAEQPAERRCRHASRRLAGGAAGGDHQLRDQQDRPHADPRAAADRSHQPGGDGGRHRQRSAPTASTTWQPRSAEDLDRITSLVKSAIGYRREARRPGRSGEHALRRRRRRAGGRRRRAARLAAREGRSAAPGADRAVRR